MTNSEKYWLVKQAMEEPWKLGYSEIDGKGIFATSDLEPGEFVAHAGDLSGSEWELSDAGRYTNHSEKKPNAQIDASDGKMQIVTKTPIKADDEITVSYPQVWTHMAPHEKLIHKGKEMPPFPTEGKYTQ